MNWFIPVLAIIAVILATVVIVDDGDDMPPDPHRQWLGCYVDGQGRAFVVNTTAEEIASGTVLAWRGKPRNAAKAAFDAGATQVIAADERLMIDDAHAFEQSEGCVAWVGPAA